MCPSETLKIPVFDFIPHTTQMYNEQNGYILLALSSFKLLVRPIEIFNISNGIQKIFEAFENQIFNQHTSTLRF